MLQFRHIGQQLLDALLGITTRTGHVPFLVSNLLGYPLVIPRGRGAEVGGRATFNAIFEVKLAISGILHVGPWYANFFARWHRMGQKRSDEHEQFLFLPLMTGIAEERSEI